MKKKSPVVFAHHCYMVLERSKYSSSEGRKLLLRMIQLGRNYQENQKKSTALKEKLKETND